MAGIVQLFDFYVRGRHRLESVPLIALGSTIAQAIALYGEPYETKPAEETAEITEHNFAVGAYHAAHLCEWQGTIQSITYWSTKADPMRDLKKMLDQYGEGHPWNVMEAGYWYQRGDGLIRLWCSVVPAIGVAPVEFLVARGQFKKARELEQILSLPDPCWAAGHAIEEIQRRHVEEQDLTLLEFARRCDRIAVSPDGRFLFLVRQHHSYDYKENFMRLNKAPDLATGYATESVICFAYEKKLSWNVRMPKDAEVVELSAHGDSCHLKIQEKKSGGRILEFRASPLLMREFWNPGEGLECNNQKLWETLERMAKRAKESPRDCQ